MSDVLTVHSDVIWMLDHFRADVADFLRRRVDSHMQFRGQIPTRLQVVTIEGKPLARHRERQLQAMFEELVKA